MSRSISEPGELTDLQKEVFNAVKKDNIKLVETILRNKS